MIYKFLIFRHFLKSHYGSLSNSILNRLLLYIFPIIIRFLFKLLLRKFVVFVFTCIFSLFFASYILKCKETFDFCIVLSLLASVLLCPDLPLILTIVRRNSLILKTFLNIYKNDPLDCLSAPISKLNEGFNTFIKNFPGKAASYKFCMNDPAGNLERLLEMEKQDRYWKWGCYFGGFCVVVGVLSGLGYLGYLYWVVPAATSSPETTGQLVQNTARIVTSSPELVTSVIKDIAPVVGQLATDSATTASSSANVASEAIRLMSHQKGAVHLIAKSRLTELQQFGIGLGGAVLLGKGVPSILHSPDFFKTMTNPLISQTIADFGTDFVQLAQSRTPGLCDMLYRANPNELRELCCSHREFVLDILTSTKPDLKGQIDDICHAFGVFASKVEFVQQFVDSRKGIPYIDIVTEFFRTFSTA